MFGFGKKKTTASYLDKVWKTEEASWKGLAEASMKLILEKKTPLVTCFFPSDRRRMEEYFTRQQVPFGAVDRDGTDSGPAVWTLLWPKGKTDALGLHLRQYQVSLLLPGHYPLPATEDQWLTDLQQWSGGQEAVFYLSLDAPLMQRFGGDRLRGLMEQLGMGAEESVEHPMVKTALVNARQKVARAVTLEQSALSEEDWFNKNYPVDSAT